MRLGSGNALACTEFGEKNRLDLDTNTVYTYFVRASARPSDAVQWAPSFNQVSVTYVKGGVPVQLSRRADR